MMKSSSYNWHMSLFVLCMYGGFFPIFSSSYIAVAFVSSVVLYGSADMKIVTFIRYLQFLGKISCIWGSFSLVVMNRMYIHIIVRRLWKLGVKNNEHEATESRRKTESSHAIVCVYIPFVEIGRDYHFDWIPGHSINNNGTVSVSLLQSTTKE